MTQWRSRLHLVAVVTLTISARAAFAAGQDGPAPRKWVPVVADYEASGPEGTVRGTLWRGADGSIRLETGTGLTAPHIQIRNLSRDIFYEFRALAGWTSLPLGDRQSAIDSDDAAGERTTVVFEGRAAERRVAPDGRVDVVVPELNSLPVDRTLPDGSRVRLRNVRSNVSPSPLLFEPPAGAFVRWLGPSGMRREFREDLRDLPEPR